MSLNSIESSLNKSIYIPGRLETIYNHSGKTIIIDYAHTPDAFENVLGSLCKLNYKKIITVFGCGGDRDISKRAPMASIAEKYSTEVIVTSDNPRTESLNNIMNDIKSGFNLDNHIFISDRNEALMHAVKQLAEGSLLIVLGKGVESYQEINGVKIPYDERKIILEAVNEN